MKVYNFLVLYLIPALILIFIEWVILYINTEMDMFRFQRRYLGEILLFTNLIFFLLGLFHSKSFFNQEYKTLNSIISKEGYVYIFDKYNIKVLIKHWIFYCGLYSLLIIFFILYINVKYNDIYYNFLID